MKKDRMKTFYIDSTRIVTFKVLAANDDAAIAAHLDGKSEEIGDVTLDLEVEEAQP